MHLPREQIVNGKALHIEGIRVYQQVFLSIEAQRWISIDFEFYLDGLLAPDLKIINAGGFFQKGGDHR